MVGGEMVTRDGWHWHACCLCPSPSPSLLSSSSLLSPSILCDWLVWRMGWEFGSHQQLPALHLPCTRLAALLRLSFFLKTLFACHAFACLLHSTAFLPATSFAARLACLFLFVLFLHCTHHACCTLHCCLPHTPACPTTLRFCCTFHCLLPSHHYPPLSHNVSVT